VISSIPSPTTGVWHLGPLPLRAYAVCILAGIVLAVWVTGRRLADRGHLREKAIDISAWAVPFGIVGGRIYHVITTPEPYFGSGGDPVRALFIWEGGLGIWGAISLGALGAWLGARRHGVPFRDYIDAAAPGVALAQAVGRWGNWFNNELYGRPTDLPWGLTIHEWDQSAGKAVRDAQGDPVVLGTFHPIFLYEALWCLLLALVLVLVDRRWRLQRGQLFGLYVAGYPVGRIVFEFMRTDEANEILGLRVNVWTSVLVFGLGVAIVWANRRSGRADTTPAPGHPQEQSPEQSPEERTSG
jgi:prolipoprotein diacylglyceryl transferase